MGLRFRKKITTSSNGKNWLNISRSGITRSTKIGNITINSDSKGIRRTTVNFGGGWSAVSGRGRKKNTIPTQSPTIFDNPLVLMWIIGISVVVMIIDALFL